MTVLELPASWGDPDRVLAAVDRELERGPETDLVLLPEASLTGYVSDRGDFDIGRFAEPLGGPTATAVAALAKRRGVNLVAPLVVEEGGRLFNTMIAVDRRGAPLFSYRKRHPWFPETWATAGSDPAPVLEIEGVKVTVAICFDVHFLEEDAAAALESSDLLLFPSAWVEEQDSRPTLLADLARRHRLAIANANWGPGIVEVAGQGGSSIIDARGETLARVGEQSVAISPLELRIFRADALLEL